MSQKQWAYSASKELSTRLFVFDAVMVLTGYCTRGFHIWYRRGRVSAIVRTNEEVKIGKEWYTIGCKTTFQKGKEGASHIRTTWSRALSVGSRVGSLGSRPSQRDFDGHTSQMRVSTCLDEEIKQPQNDRNVCSFFYFNILSTLIMNCIGTLTERAARLFSLRGLERKAAGLATGLSTKQKRVKKVHLMTAAIIIEWKDRMCSKGLV